MVSLEVKDDGAVATYRTVANGFPIPQTEVFVNGVDSNGVVYPAYINTTNGRLVTRKAYTNGTWVRYNFVYAV